MERFGKVLASVLVIGLLFVNSGIGTFAASAGNSNISDIKGHWAEKMIEQLLDKKIITGVRLNGIVKIQPDRTMTRAEFITILSRSREFAINTGKLAAFEDVKSNSWFKDSLDRMTSNSIISGYKDNTFRPDNPISRGEIAAIVCKAYELDKIQDSMAVTTGTNNETTAKFKDVSSKSWYYESVLLCKQYGIINGYPDGRFGPENSAKRAECFSILAKLMALSTAATTTPTVTATTTTTPTATTTSTVTPTTTTTPTATTTSTATTTPTSAAISKPAPVYNPSGLIGYKMTGTAGGKVYYQVYAFGMDELGKFSVKISYDPKIVLPSNSYAGTVKSGSYLSSIDTSTAASGCIVVNSNDGSKAVKGRGVIFTVQFDVQAASGSTDIALEPEMYDTSGNLIKPVSVDQGSITIKQ